MSSDRDTTRIVRSWLDEGVTQLPDRVLDAVLDQVPATRQRRATWWPARRLPTMNAIMKVGLAAAVLAVAAYLGITYLGNGSGVGGPDTQSPTLTAEPTPTQTPEATGTEPLNPRANTGELPAGSTFTLMPTSPVGAVSITIPAPDWAGEPSGGIVFSSDGGADPPDGAGLIVYPEGGEWYVPEDPCDWSSSVPESPVTTVAEIAAALAAQPSREGSAPVDVSVAGHDGLSFTLRVPDDADFGDCVGTQFCSLVRDPGSAGSCWRFHQGPGQIDRFWVVDVDGVPVIIDAAWYDESHPEQVIELQAMVESMTFGE